MTDPVPEAPNEIASAGSPPAPSTSLLRRAEDWFCAGLMFVMIAAGLLAVGRRFVVKLPVIGDWVLGGSLSWPEPLGQHLVLWVALFGAGAAAADRSHIAIDALAYVLPQRFRRVAGMFTNLTTALLCGVFTWLAVGFTAAEFENNGRALTFFGLHACWLTVVLPAGFALLTLRSLMILVADARALCRTAPAAEETASAQPPPAPPAGNGGPAA